VPISQPAACGQFRGIGPRITLLHLASDGSRAIYERTRSGFSCVTPSFLFSSAMDASTEAPLSPGPLSYEVGVVGVAPDSSTVAFSQDSARRDLFSTPSAGGAVTTLATGTGQDVQSVSVTPDSARVLFTGDIRTPGVRELFSTPIGGADAAGADGDADGFGGACDCSPAVADVWSTPGPAGGLLFPDRTQLVWDAPGEPGATSVRYDLLRSTSADDFTDASVVCVESDDGADRTAIDGDTPAPGATNHYLVRAENDCGPGGLGSGSDGVPRAGRDCP
jgi:dipeptidyl aminopeptidase/acylaminoacyl peptidase